MVGFIGSMPIYEYQYVGDERNYVGFMADEIARAFPDDVAEGYGGFLLVSEDFAPIEI